jgi:formylglycine-generating enzyme required for sulfatase activity
MSRAALLTLAVALTVVAGCNKNNSNNPVVAAPVEPLPAIEPKSGGKMVLVPAGSFSMGDGAGRPDEAPHNLSLNAFYIDQYPVTQELYEKVLGVNPSKRKDPNNPVENTRWTDAVRFCNECSKLEGLTPCYDLTTWKCNFEADGYRLPTEAEWEYACRAGSTTRFCFGDAENELSQYAWLKSTSQGKPHPVGEKRPNRWGLFDVHGNVWQWCNDWYGQTYYTESSADDPHGPATGEMRVLRGGAWDSTPDKCRSAYRHKEVPVFADACFGADSYGFRRARKAGTSDQPKQVAVPIAKEDGLKVKDPQTKVEKSKSAVKPPTGLGKIDSTALRGTIVFISDRSGVIKIWSMRANGKDVKQLTQGENPDADPRFSPDGKRILYTTKREGFPEIMLMTRDGADAKFVTKGSQGNWAPDGQSIVFIRDDQAYVRDLASGTEKLVTPKEWERCGVPAFSPDGKRIAVASRHTGNIGIFILGVDGQENSQLKADEACCTPSWSNDGKKILCQTVQGHIHQVGLDGKNWEQLTFGADVQHNARYSPDGTMILFCRAPTPEGPWQICLKRLDGDDDEFITLTQDGSNLLPDWSGQE